MFSKIDPISALENSLAILPTAYSGKSFQPGQVAVTTNFLDAKGTVLPQGVIAFNEDSYIFTGSVGRTNILEYYNEDRRNAWGLGLLSVENINELILLHELMHLDDTTGKYNDAGTGNPTLNELIRKNCF